VNNIDQCKTMPDKLPEPQRSLFLWLAELLLDVARKEGVNKMGPGNLGTLPYSSIIFVRWESFTNYSYFDN